MKLQSWAPAQYAELPVPNVAAQLPKMLVHETSEKGPTVAEQKPALRSHSSQAPAPRVTPEQPFAHSR
ncbi:MAG: hypothetical protein IPJ65_18125 [Archangiaceae bacterium]|nr:hypothetical protein [Archangiaceae bacterium]